MKPSRRAVPRGRAPFCRAPFCRAPHPSVVAFALLVAAAAALIASAVGWPPTVAAGGFGSVVAAAGPRPAAEGEAVSARARAALARIGPESRLDEIKDERLRQAAQTAYRALSEIAAEREPAKSAPAHARFERAYAAVRREAARARLGNCASNCAADGDACRRDCKGADKKSCGCHFEVFSCIVAECLF